MESYLTQSTIIIMPVLFIGLFFGFLYQLNRKKIIPIKSLPWPIFVFITGLFSKFYAYFGSPELELQVGLTIIFVGILYIYSYWIFPFIFNSSIFQWVLYLFLRLENYKYANSLKALNWGLYLCVLPSLYTLMFFLYFKLDAKDYIVIFPSLFALFFGLSKIVEYFLNPKIEGFQFIDHNQKLEEITWNDFIRSMSFVSTNLFKNRPIRNSIGYSKSNYAFSYITKRSVFRLALTKTAIALTEHSINIASGCAIATVGITLFGTHQLNKNQAETSKAIVEAAKITAKAQVDVAQINTSSQERIANIQQETAKITANAQVDVAQINAQERLVQTLPLKDRKAILKSKSMDDDGIIDIGVDYTKLKSSVSWLSEWFSW